MQPGGKGIVGSELPGLSSQHRENILGDFLRRAGVFDLAQGGSIQGELAGLNRLVDLVIPEFRSEGGTYVIPGHGRICDTADLAYYRDMVTIIRDRVQDAVKRGLTLEQVKTARLSKDYDPRYDVPSWTKDQFVEAVYNDLRRAGLSGPRSR